MNQYNNHEDLEPTIFSLGHSNRTYDEFQELLINADIQTVIDCRSRPRSRFPQYNLSRLESNLADSSIYYEFKGDSLGGLNKNIGQDEAITELTERAKRGERIALMCSEAKYQACHRGTILTPLFEANGIKVKHLLYKGVV